MRVMVLVKADGKTEAGQMPTEAELSAMGAFNEELVKAGIMLTGDGLHPSTKGARVRFGDGKKSVIDGPFTEAKELVAGYWIWEVKSLDEAVEWLKRAPFPTDGDPFEVEIRQVFEAEDFGEAYTDDLRESENRMRETIASQRG